MNLLMSQVRVWCSFATILRAKGFSLEEIQLILGHSSRVTTEVYAKLTFTPDVKDRYLQLFEGGNYYGN
jgi:site-specific recombinase XerD